MASLHCVNLKYHVQLSFMIGHYTVQQISKPQKLILKANSHASVLGKAKKHLASLTSS